MSVHSKDSRESEAGPVALMVVTDLDGSLLDEHTYSFAPALPALARLADRGAVLALASSKTRSEMESIAVRLQSAGPLIAENGALLLLPCGGGGYEAHATGVERGVLIDALAEISNEAGAQVRGFSTLDASEVSRLTGLPLPAAQLSLDREYDEPFLLKNRASADRLARAARRRGLVVTRGGRFFHLTGLHDKGTALRQLLALETPRVRAWHTIGLGDAVNDLPLLRQVDRPIVIPGPDGFVRRELLVGLPAAERAAGPGPKGWNDAMLAVLEGRSLPTVAGGGWR